MVRLVAALCMATLVCGCSASMRTVSDTWKPPAPPACTTSPVKPLVDLGIAVGSGVGAAIAYPRADLDDAAWVTATALGAVGAVVFWYGSLLGANNVRKCRNAHRALQQWQLNIGTARP